MSGMSCVGHHQLAIVDRGGGRSILRLRDVGSVSWTRALSAQSKASLTINGQACRAQQEALASIHPRRHELAIFRDNERVWEGPITDVKNLTDSTSIQAGDVSEYLYGTALSKWWPGPEDGGAALATARIDEIIRHELTTAYTRPVTGGTRTFQRWEQLSPAANVLPFLDVRPSTLPAAAETLPFQMTVGEHLDALAKLGLRYTVVGRRIIIWDGEVALARTSPLSERDLGEQLNLHETSQDFAAVQHVVGQASSDPEDVDAVGTSGTVDPYYGAWEVIDTAQEVDDDDDIMVAVREQADRLYNERRDMKLNIIVPSGGSLRLSESVRIRDLVPGVEVPVVGTVNRKQVAARYILQEITVTEDSGGEKVSIKLDTEAEVA